MKKVILILMIIVSFLFIGGCEYAFVSNKVTPTPYKTPEPFDIKIPDDLRFGMKESEIISLYGTPDLEYGNIISYEKFNKEKDKYIAALDESEKDKYAANLDKRRKVEYVADFDKCELVLGITDKGLQMVQYAFGYDYDSKNIRPYLQNTETLKNGVIRDYGDDFQYAEKWKNEKYKDDYNSWNKAIQNNQLEITYTWSCEEYIITLRTTGTGIFLDYGAK